LHKELDVCGSREALVTSLRPLQRLRIILLIALEQIYVGGKEERHIQLLRYIWCTMLGHHPNLLIIDLCLYYYRYYCRVI
jgi:hypothetical protein